MATYFMTRNVISCLELSSSHLNCLQPESNLRNKNLLSMTKLHYVGFNGYQQCPKTEEGLPKVISKWISIEEDGMVNGCTHRFVVLETKVLFKIYGVVNDASFKRLQVVAKPAGTDIFGSCDEFLIASNGTDISKYNYQTSKWSKFKLNFANEKEKILWEETGNRILKFSFQKNLKDVLLLLKNGSVWMVSEGKLKLIYPCDLDKAIDISSGLEHSVILTECGCVLTFGNGSRGQLGHGDLNQTSQPIQVAALEGLKVIKIASGGWHSCAVTDSGDLYVWGWNNFGQLSAFENGESVGLTALPVFVEVGEESGVKVTDVACGKRHTVAVLENGNMYSTGWNTYSQLGIDLLCEKVLKFTKCQIQRNQNQKLVCGPWYTILVEELK